jgi:hypothetical protein
MRVATEPVRNLVQLLMLVFARGFFPLSFFQFPPKRRLLLQDPHYATSRKTAFFIVTSVKTPNPTICMLVFYSPLYTGYLRHSVRSD